MEDKLNIRFKKIHFLYYIILSLICLLIILPFVWLVSTSFDRLDTYSLPYPPRLIPRNPSLFNYQMAVSNVPIIRYLINTIIIVLISLILNIFVATLSGFCLSKGKFPGKNIILIFILSSMMVPYESKLMPMYNIIKSIGLSNNFLGVLLPGVMTNAIYLFFIKKFCDDLPDDLYDAGVVDGANKFTIYVRIFLPLMKTIIATLAILDVVNNWNDLLWPMIVLSKNELNTIQLGLIRYMSGASGQVHAGISTALSILSVLPLAMVFVFLQKYIVQSIASTGIKQ